MLGLTQVGFVRKRAMGRASHKADILEFLEWVGSPLRVFWHGFKFEPFPQNHSAPSSKVSAIPNYMLDFLVRTVLDLSN